MRSWASGMDFPGAFFSSQQKKVDLQHVTLSIKINFDTINENEAHC